MSNLHTALFQTRHNIGIPLKHTIYIFDIPLTFSHHLCKEHRTRCELILISKHLLWSTAIAYQNYRPIKWHVGIWSALTGIQYGRGLTSHSNPVKHSLKVVDR